MLSRTAEYAVRAVVFLAKHYDDRLVGTDEIATGIGAPRNYLSKTLNALTRAGILTSARGPGGGFSLAMPPEALSVARVADVFAEIRPATTQCLLGDRDCDRANPCMAHLQWTAITMAAREPLLQTAISELSGSRNKHARGRPAKTAS